MRSKNEIAEILPAAEEKPIYVNQMFARIAERYDRLNSLMSMGQDSRWHREALSLCDLPATGRLLDVGTGTGAVARAGRAMYPEAEIVATDFTWEMVQAGIGKGKGSERPVSYALGDAFELPFQDDRFDATITSFVMRNVVDWQVAFEEQLRVIKPGGRVVCLETSPPHVSALGPLFRFYFFRVVPVMGALIAGDGSAYKYLPASTVDFPAPDALARIMELAGLRNVIYRTLMFGSVAIHVGTK